MLVTSQLPIQPQKFSIVCFDVYLCPPLWKRFRHHSLGCCYYFASRKKICYFASSGLNKQQKLDFTLFLLFSHKGWTAALVRCLLSTTPMYSTVNCASATSYNYDATITLFLIAQQWTTRDATTLNISFSAICTQQGCQFGFFEAKFPIFGSFVFLTKGQMKFGFFWPFSTNEILYVDLADLKMVLADFWHWQISRHCSWTQNDKFLVEILHENL